MHDADLPAWVQLAVLGDAAAWERLVDRYANLVWSIARAYGLNDADAADVSQTTWLRLAESIHRLRRPEKLASWLATTTHREALRIRRLSRRQPAIHDVQGSAVTVDPSDVVVEKESASAIRLAMQTLPLRRREFLEALLSDPAPSYAELAHEFNMPVGSIGPTRARCLAELRRALRLTNLADQVPL